MLLVVDSAAEIEKRWLVVQMDPENYASLLKISNVVVASSLSLAEVEGGTEKRTTQTYMNNRIRLSGLNFKNPRF